MRRRREGEPAPNGLSWNWSRPVWGLTLEYMTRNRNTKYRFRVRFWYYDTDGPGFSPLLEAVELTRDGGYRGGVWKWS